jgi:hypothetical protein
MQDQRDLQARLEEALAEGRRLQEEVCRLKAILAQHSIPLPDPTPTQSATERCLPAPAEIAQVGTLSDNEAKVALFRYLFRGREDVYAERWRTKDELGPIGQRVRRIGLQFSPVGLKNTRKLINEPAFFTP